MGAAQVERVAGAEGLYLVLVFLQLNFQGHAGRLRYIRLAAGFIMIMMISSGRRTQWSGLYANRCQKIEWINEHKWKSLPKERGVLSCVCVLLLGPQLNSSQLSATENSTQSNSLARSSVSKLFYLHSLIEILIYRLCLAKRIAGYITRRDELSLVVRVSH